MQNDEADPKGERFPLPTGNCFLVIGCGRFGRRAARILLERYPGAKVTVVDKDPDALKKASGVPLETAVHDGISYLNRSLTTGTEFEYIIPAIPVHVAFEFMLRRFGPLGVTRTECPALPNLPNLLPGRTGDVYSSLADFVCPEDCPEPVDHCTVTGKKRRESLYETLGGLKGPFDPKVIRSRQLGPGVGGFRTEELLSLAADIKKSIGSGGLTLVSTACRCHGVTSALSLK